MQNKESLLVMDEKPTYEELKKQLEKCSRDLSRSEKHLQKLKAKPSKSGILNKNRELELRIDELTAELERKNIALKEVFSQLEIEKENLTNRIEVNVQKLLLPVIEKLINKSSSLDSRYLVMIKQNLEQLTSSAGIRLSSLEYNLTPKEIELCALIRGGFSIKEIAAMHNLSERTVETHRFKIRKKLGISSTSVNLSSYLASL
jgi:DNA-binding CsgD family transcriptional regulator